MTKIFRSGLFWFQSDNRHSKTCTALSRSIQNRNWFALGATLLALSFPAQAQQPEKVPRIAYLLAGSAAGQGSNIEAL